MANGLTLSLYRTGMPRRIQNVVTPPDAVAHGGRFGSGRHLHRPRQKPSAIIEDDAVKKTVLTGHERGYGLAMVLKRRLGDTLEHTAPHQGAAADDVDAPGMNGFVRGSFGACHPQKAIVDTEGRRQRNASAVDGSMVVFPQSQRQRGHRGDRPRHADDAACARRLDMLEGLIDVLVHIPSGGSDLILRGGIRQKMALGHPHRADVHGKSLADFRGRRCDAIAAHNHLGRPPRPDR